MATYLISLFEPIQIIDWSFVEDQNEQTKRGAWHWPAFWQRQEDIQK